jgi:hypothetical protein
VAKRRTADFSPVTPDENPLSTRNYTEMNQGQALINRAERKIERMRAAGVACDQYDAQCKYLQDRFARLKSVYFPERS